MKIHSIASEFRSVEILWIEIKKVHEDDTTTPPEVTKPTQ